MSPLRNNRTNHRLTPMNKIIHHGGNVLVEPSAFVELLAVLAVIDILAPFLLSALGRTGGCARRIALFSNNRSALTAAVRFDLFACTKPH